MDYKKKYLKYKTKYLNLKGGEIKIFDNDDFFINFNTVKEHYLEKYHKFIDAEMIIFPITKLKQISDNGFIFKLPFYNKIDEHNFNALMKTCTIINSDNNYYEYLTGLCINEFKQYFPNFTYTFAYATQKDDLLEYLKQDNKILKTNFDRDLFVDSIKINSLKDTKTLSFETIEMGCVNNDRTSIIIECINNMKSTRQLLSSIEFTENFDYNFFCILFQLYATLSSLSNLFTHYDLHYENVIFSVYDKPIEINYATKFGPIKIFTKYIPVIIDYGRCFVNCYKLNNNVQINSGVIAEMACKTNCNTILNDLHGACNTVPYGMHFIKTDDLTFSHNEDNWYINPKIKNNSSDLRFVNDIIYDLMYFDVDSNLCRRLNEFKDRRWDHYYYRHIDGTEKMAYIAGVTEKDNTYEYLSDTGTISTVNDLFAMLVRTYYKFKYNDIVITDIFGTMNIDCDIDKRKKWSFKHK